MKHLVNNNRGDHAQSQYKEESCEDEMPEFFWEFNGSHGAGRNYYVSRKGAESCYKRRKEDGLCAFAFTLHLCVKFLWQRNIMLPILIFFIQRINDRLQMQIITQEIGIAGVNEERFDIVLLNVLRVSFL